MKVSILNNSDLELPEYATILSAGMDLRANINEAITLGPGERNLVSTGLKIALPPGYEAQIRPRSGWAVKYGITVLNAPGTIDADYRGEIKVILINHGSEPFTIRKGDRIAQMVISKHETIEWKEIDELEQTERGAGGFGHTGKS